MLQIQEYLKFRGLGSFRVEMDVMGSFMSGESFVCIQPLAVRGNNTVS